MGLQRPANSAIFLPSSQNLIQHLAYTTQHLDFYAINMIFAKQQNMKSAIQIFRIHHESIKRLIRANDVYGLVKLFALRKDPVLLNLAKNVIMSDGVSSIADSKDIYESDDEINELEEREELTYACEQSVLSTYTAFEKYLVNKFWELVRKKGVNAEGTDVKHFMGLGAIATIYKNELNIDLTAFNDQDIELNEDDWFFAESPWQAIEALKQAKNEISHEGHSSRYDISHVEDSFFVHEFIDHWVRAFDALYE